MVRRKTSRKAPLTQKLLLWTLLLALVVSIIFMVRLYKRIFTPAAVIESEYLYIPSGSRYEDVLNLLEAKQVVTDPKAFDWLARKKNYPSNIKPGRYRLTSGINNNDLINKLRAGQQDPIMLQFNNIRTLAELAGRVSRQIEPDSLSLLMHLLKPEVAESYGFSMQEFPAMFIPNSYEFYWTSSEKQFTDRMKQEYTIFWSKGRQEKAEKIGLNRIEVSTLASLVDQESLHNDENPTIAGVFINRLKTGMPLQSDPTIIFAWNDFSMRRVLNKHKEIDSPYNTYKYKGLPPGPICIPSISAIDAVLNYERHNYLYFCAKPDFSGYHIFARNLSQHNENARLYQQALNRRKIYR